MGEFQKRYNKAAYGKPVAKPKAGGLIDAGSRIGTRIVQLVYLRPPAYGYRVATKRK